MYFVFAALTFGVVSGVKPGPLGVYVIHQTMSKGIKGGFLASLAPIVTDGPIILLVLLFTFQLKDIEWFISAISAFGAIYLAYLAYKILKGPSVVDPTDSKIESSSLVTAVKINILNQGHIFSGSQLAVVIFLWALKLTQLCLFSVRYLVFARPSFL